MKNPCEECLVKAVCIIPCENLNKFSGSLSLGRGHVDYYSDWLKNYECRPAVLELISNLQVNLKNLTNIELWNLKNGRF